MKTIRLLGSCGVVFLVGVSDTLETVP